MREIHLYFDDALVRDVLINIQPQQIDDAVIHYTQLGEYRIAATLLQLAGALAASPVVDVAPGPLVPIPPRDVAGQAAHGAQWTRGTRDGRRAAAESPLQETPFQQAALQLVRPGDTAVIPLPESHAPTMCTFHVQGAPCGELVRWSEVNGWYHVSDRQLGASAHPATPGPVVRGVERPATPGA